MSNSINKTWHEKHRMKMPTTLEERTKWHEAHLKNCGCRKDLPKTIIVALKSQGKRVCNRGHIHKGSGPCFVCWPGGEKKKI
jgi:hypothetical protein